MSDSEATKVNLDGNEKRRNIILIGRTGNDKSTLANVICGKENVFQEGKYNVSQTRDIQIEKFTDDGVNYRIIDTIGIGDTKKTKREVLNKIADATHKVRDGLHQILFVTKGKFAEQERETYITACKIKFRFLNPKLSRYWRAIYLPKNNLDNGKNT
jgi:predicted GTPase